MFNTHMYYEKQRLHCIIVCVVKKWNNFAPKMEQFCTLSIISNRSFVQILYIKGPMTEPRGVLFVIIAKSLILSHTLTLVVFDY